VVSQVCFFPKRLLLGDHATPVNTDEVTSHLQSRVLVNQDMLARWKKQTQFPQLWALAQQLFAIPASSAASERSFSAAGCTLHCRLRTLMTTCLYIRIEFNDYFVTVVVIAQMYAILAIYDVLIVF